MSMQARRPQMNARPSAAVQQRRRIIAIASVVLLAVVIVVAIALANRVPESASTAPIDSTIKVGDKAPDFTLSTTGGPFTLSAAGDKPTLLEVFATWCPHCQREAPVLSALAARYKDKVNFVGVAGSPNAIDGTTAETQADVVAWAQQFHATYPVAFDPNLDVAHKYLQGGFPTVVLIAGGKVVAIRSGEMPSADISRGIDATLAGKKTDAKLGAKV